jgi:ferritin-like metal-binding protein YciE
MEKLIYLEDLLKHSLLELFSAEEQMMKVLPFMMEKASNPELKVALGNHLEITFLQKERLEEMMSVLKEENSQKEGSLFSTVFGNNDSVTSFGTEGILKEAHKIMNASDHAGMMDAVIVAAAQKIEHYEIAAYGTARVYAKELGLAFIEGELEKTLREEYEADDTLTKIAENGLINQLLAIPALTANEI